LLKETNDTTAIKRGKQKGERRKGEKGKERKERERKVRKERENLLLVSGQRTT